MFLITDSKKMKKYVIETQGIILRIYVINFPIYEIKFPVNFKYRSSHRWCFFNKIFSKGSQYLQENIYVRVPSGLQLY